MAVFSKESLESLRQKVDLVEVVSPYVKLKKTGASYKAVCPFHNEKSPSFHIQSGDTHYHCFGCGAHGDAIAFLMNHLKIEFSEAVEMLAEKFGVTLAYKEREAKEKGVDTALLKRALNQASDFYHFHLLYTDEGQRALHYLYKRGLDLDFIKNFAVGFSPKEESVSLAFFRESGLQEKVLIDTGLVKQTENGRMRPFFTNRIMFPIHDNSENVIGFSARKIDESTFGGKYINTPETPLFKKSKVLFGLNYSRKRIAKERKVILVEGQIDALRLIHEGLNMVVASQGTAFGENHVDIIHKLGVNHVYLAFDGDLAGQEAIIKVGQLFQIKGIEVSILALQEDDDPDSIIQKEGVEGFLQYIKHPIEFIPFIVNHFSKTINVATPAGKNELVQKIVSYIRAWNHPVMIHEGLRKLAELLKVPEALIEKEEFSLPPEKKTFTSFAIDVVRILETDLLRWLFLAGKKHPEIVEMTKKNLTPDDFFDTAAKKLFILLLENLTNNEPLELLSLAPHMTSDEHKLLELIHQKKVNGNKAKEGIIEVIQKILERNWMHKREEIKKQMENRSLSESALSNLIKEFDELKKNPPKVLLS